MGTKVSLLFATVLFTASCGIHAVKPAIQKERWNSANDPMKMLPRDYEFSLANLPLEGEIELKPWADTYWPSNRGGIAYRWQTGDEGHSFQPVTPSGAASMSLADLAKLSPAEKFDIFVGDENMSLFRNEQDRTSPSDGAWFGICHGWAPASIAFKEPHAIIVKSAAGIDVPFGSSDIKALISLHSADYGQSQTKFLASRCNIDISRDPSAADRPECKDTNAGAFHLVLTNLIGRKKEGFVADVTRDLEVWNQPVSGYTSQIIRETNGASRGAAPTTVKEVEVQTTMTYGREISAQWESAGTSLSSKRYKYRLEIDANGNIVGGEWLTEDRPDFLWQESVPAFVPASGRSRRTIDWRYLEVLYKAAIEATEDVANPNG
jgi:hypothetical protein